MKNYIYIFTRKNLEASQVAVQSIHAAFELGRHSCPNSIHPSVILIKTADEQGLKEIENFIQSTKLPYKSFKEPYYNNSLTSLAVSVTEQERVLFKKFKLFRNKDFKQKTEEK